eukprot:2466542-Pleurochrysis_carterae.AAC.3
MGHGQVFTAVYADGGIYVIPPHDPVGCIRPAAMFYLVPVATIMETMFNMELLGISGCRNRRP